MPNKTIINHWLKEGRRVASPNFDERPGQEAPSLIVIHCISLPPREFGSSAIEALFTNTLDPGAHPFFAEIHQLRVAAHLLIRRTGEVVQFVAFDQRAWHAGISSYRGRDVCNDYSIGIELEGTEFSPYEDIQYTELNECLEVLLRTYPSLAKDRIVSHSEIAPDRKPDPGPFFEWQRVLP
jgi:AmpD protein